MGTNNKRFTISLTPALETELNKLKKEVYYAEQQSKMVRDVIARGLIALKEDKPIQPMED